MEPKPCRYCNGTFTPAKKSTAFCSRSCLTKWLRQENILVRPKKGVTKTCKNCNEEFYVPKYRENTAIYCSRKCLALANPQITEKARNNSPIMARKGQTVKRNYKTITVNGVQVREHRYVVEQHLGRKLERWEHVHHIDGDHLNNSIENLEVLTNAEHQRKELAQWSVTKLDNQS